MSKKVSYRKDQNSKKRVPKTVFVDKDNWGRVKRKHGNMSAWVDGKVEQEASHEQGDPSADE